MKTLDDVKQNMSDLYDRVLAGSIERDLADSLANICGKFLKADALQLARDIFEADCQRRRLSIPTAAEPKLLEQ